MTSFIDSVTPGNGVVRARLAAHPEGSGMFNVPNPESGIDPDSTDEDGRAAFLGFLVAERKRLLASP
jgi:hypothetical protein